ncbi:MAG: polymerase, sigma-24 subunit, subfamily [Verrucomicrobiales bacterium]|nr:polymerase, sigma-24 subunit, subfamily [Verrucomicrobiales bacterium]
MSPTDTALLNQFTVSHDESAFRELVRRYFDLVLSTALRRVNGERPLAEDISQIVFTDLAAQAPGLPGGVSLGGWLQRHTCFIAGKALRTEIRRRTRESHAAQTLHSPMDPSSPPPVTELAAALDDGLLALSDTDRRTLVMRYLERRDLRSIGISFGVSEDTAQKRVTRALEKLRIFLENRSLSPASISTGMAALLSASPAEAAGSALVEEVARRSLTSAFVSAGSASGSPGLTNAAQPAGTRSILAGRLATGPGTALLAVTAALLGGASSYWVGQRLAAGDAASASPSKSAVAAASGNPADSIAAPPTDTKAPPVASTKNPPPDQADLAGKILELTRFTTGNEEGMEEARRLVRALDPARFPTLLQEINRRPMDWRLRGTAATMILGEWARTDPAAAMAASRGEVPQALVLQRWMQKDREAALAWLDTQVAEEGVSKRTTALVRSAVEQLTAARSLPEALSLAGRLSLPASANDIFSDITRLTTTPEERAQVQSAIAALPDPATREQARRGHVGSWANADREGVRLWIEAQPRGGRDGLVEEYARVWMWEDPAATASWWVAQSDDPQAAIRGAMETWRPEKINDAGAWLQRQGLGPRADEGLAAFARAALLQDPGAALTWASVISDPSLRERTSTGLFQTWLEHDRVSASAYLNNASMPADTKIRLETLTRLPKP